MKERQEQLNKAIRSAGPHVASRFPKKAMETIMRDGGPLWTYEGPSYNNNNFRAGFEQTFGKRDDIGSNLAKKE